MIGSLSPTCGEASLELRIWAPQTDAKPLDGIKSVDEIWP